MGTFRLSRTLCGIFFPLYGTKGEKASRTVIRCRGIPLLRFWPELGMVEGKVSKEVCL